MLLLDDDKVGSADVAGFTRLLGIPSVGSLICCFQKVLYKYIMFGVFLLALVTLILSEDHLTLLKCNQDLIILCRRRSPILKKQDLKRRLPIDQQRRRLRRRRKRMSRSINGP